MVTVPRLWPDATIVCLGGGPSLTAADVEACQGRARVIAVNDGYRLAPWADVLYAADQAWWRVHRGVPTFAGLKYSIAPMRPESGWNVHVLENTGADGLEDAPTGLRTGYNSGYQAINLAVHFGAARIVLLGYDMYGGHWFGRHPSGLRNSSSYDTFLRTFPTLAAPLAARGIAVVNCTRCTALTCFPQAPLAEGLAA